MRVAIIGGGPSGLAAAFELTAPGRVPAEDVTVYQAGWRLGGKCATGRNAEHHNRIEEHGLHVWFGCYDNAFALMRRCFAELDGDPEHLAITSLEDAFEACDLAVLGQRAASDWSFQHLTFPRRDDVALPSFLDFAHTALEWAARSADALPGRREDAGVRGGFTDVERAIEDHVRWAGASVREAVRGDQPDARKSADAKKVAETTGRASGRLAGAGASRLSATPEERFVGETVELLFAMLRGVVADGLLVRGFDAINSWDLARWLQHHGLVLDDDPLEWPAALRAVYDGCFAFEDGDVRRPRMAAGRALQGAVRCLMHYRGSVLFRPTAGMAESAIAPLYEALLARGVRFAFFHAAQELRPDASGRAVGEIDIVRQVATTDAYGPMLLDVPVDGGRRTVKGWPSAPNWDEIVGAERLGDDAANRLEHEIDPFAGARTTLRHGVDFDAVVLAVPPAVQVEICAPLRSVDPGYDRMLGASSDVVTQALQFWLTRDAEQLGQSFGSNSLMSCYVEPLDTYCDMAHLVALEDWPAEADVRHIAYFCGVLAAGTTQEQADALLHATADRFLEQDVHRVWPDSVDLDTTVFDPRLLAAGAGTGTGARPGQYRRANWAPTERYVLTLPGSVQHRLWPDGTRFENLALAGDWTRNSFDAGCVEAAVTSGMLASAAVCGAPARERIAGIHGPFGFENAPRDDVELGWDDLVRLVADTVPLATHVLGRALAVTWWLGRPLVRAVLRRHD